MFCHQVTYAHLTDPNIRKKIPVLHKARAIWRQTHVRQSANQRTWISHIRSIVFPVLCVDPWRKQLQLFCRQKNGHIITMIMSFKWHLKSCLCRVFILREIWCVFRKEWVFLPRVITAALVSFEPTNFTLIEKHHHSTLAVQYTISIRARKWRLVSCRLG